MSQIQVTLKPTFKMGDKVLFSNEPYTIINIGHIEIHGGGASISDGEVIEEAEEFMLSPCITVEYACKPEKGHGTIFVYGHNLTKV